MAKARPGLSGLCSRALGGDGVHGGDKQPPKSRVDRGIRTCDLTISLVPTKGYHCLYVHVTAPNCNCIFWEQL